MDEVPEKPAANVPPAKSKFRWIWQPFTPRGVARFANAPLARLLVLQIILAIFASCIVVWFLKANYSPAILESLQNIPDDVQLQNRRLMNASSQILTEKKFISIAIDLEETGQHGKVSDVQLELRPDYLFLCSLFGCASFNYPPETILLGRANSEPWWEAREPILLLGAGVATFVGLGVSWFFLALIYTPIAKIIAALAERELSWKGSWKLCSAAQLFAALLMTLSILFYGLQIFDLIQFLFFFAAHFLVAWFGVCVAPFFLPRISTTVPTAKNPFT